MKIKLAGEGVVNPEVKTVLTVGKIYEVVREEGNDLFIFNGDDGTEVHAFLGEDWECAWLADSLGYLYWQVIE